MELATMAQAMQLHAQVLKSGGEKRTTGTGTEQTPQGQHSRQNLSKLFTFSALSPSGDLSYARLILNSLQTPNSYYYNTMIRAYSDLPNPTQAIRLFFEMHDPGCPKTPRPDNFTFPCVLKACSKLRQKTHLGKQLHGLVCKLGLRSDTYISNALIHMYSGIGFPSLALKVFEEMLVRDVVSWTSIIDGLVDNYKPIKAINLFEHMVENDIEFNEATIVSVLRACADAGALAIGRKVNALFKERKLSLNSKVSTALIDMYAKCWCIDGAMEVFYQTVNKDVIAWTAMISGFAIHGKCKEAIELFENMKGLEIKPDERTLNAVLSACRNGRCISEGLDCFRTMKKKYKVRPTMQHYGCIVDMLAQTGHLEDAEAFMKKMPVQTDTVLWKTLIRACELHGDIERGERLMKHLELLKMDSPDSESSLATENLYASEGKWQEKGNTRTLTNQRESLKAPGYSRVEINGEVHEFTSGVLRHFEVEEIGGKLDEIALTLRSKGYHPKCSEMLHDIVDEENAFELLHHSEKLAVSFGLIRTSPGTTIRIVKNLRPCEDCHSFMKLLSNVYEREIILRDHIRFHHFRNGECSCGNFW